MSDDRKETKDQFRVVKMWSLANGHSYWVRDQLDKIRGKFDLEIDADTFVKANESITKLETVEAAKNAAVRMSEHLAEKVAAFNSTKLLTDAVIEKMARAHDPVTWSNFDRCVATWDKQADKMREVYWFMVKDSMNAMRDAVNTLT